MEQKQPGEIPQYKAPGQVRLEALAKFVETLPPGKLTFARWYGQGRGCAVGLAAAHEPWFLAQGLRLEREESLKDCRPSFAGLSDWDAVAAFFEISRAEARQLFDRAGYSGEIQPTPRQIADNIRRYLMQCEAAAACV